MFRLIVISTMHRVKALALIGGGGGQNTDGNVIKHHKKEELRQQSACQATGAWALGIMICMYVV